MAPIFAKFAETFMTTYAKTNNKISEQTAKRSILTHYLLPALGSKRLDKITGEDVENLKASIIEKGKTAKRVNNILNVLGKILRYADEIDLIERAPKIKTLKVAPQKFDFFAPEEFERLVASSEHEPEWHAAVLVAGEAGLRMGEILALEWGDIDFKAATLTVMRNDWRGQIGSPKSGKDREIPLTARAAAALKAIRHLKSRLVFCHDDGSRWTLTTMRTGIARQGGSTKDGLARAPAFVLLPSRRARRRRGRDQEAGRSLVDRRDQPLHARRERRSSRGDQPPRGGAWRQAGDKSRSCVLTSRYYWGE